MSSIDRQAVIVYWIGSGAPDFAAGGFAANGYGDLSPGKFGLVSVFVIEVVLTAMFLIVILGSTAKAAPAGFAPLAIGLALFVAHLIGIPVSNASLNPARSIASALFATTGAWSQIWLFIVAPLVGGAVGALIWRGLLGTDDKA